MQRLLPARIDAAGLFLALTLAAPAALVPTEWQHRQPLEVAQPGLVRVALPPETFDRAQADLADLRIVDPEGRELACALEHGRDACAPPATQRLAAVQGFRGTLSREQTQLRIETGVTGRVAFLELATSAPYFLKAAHVEVSADGENWTSLGPAIPVFRQFGAENLRVEIGREAPHVRVTLDDARSRRVEFTGARVLPAAGSAAEPERTGVAAQVVRREEFAGETVLTLLLPAAHLPLAALAFEAADPLFMRRVTVAVRDVSDGTPRERTIGSGTLYRVALDGAPARARLEVPVDHTPATRELIVHVHNGDSPPLQFAAVRADHWPVTLAFMAASAGRHHLLSGNASARAPRYDFAAFAGDLHRAAATRLTPGSAEVMPGYRPAESLSAPALPEIPLSGAPLDAAKWTVRRAVHIRAVGVQELELDPAALAGARPDLGDLRLLRRGNQIPYVPERPALQRTLALTPVPEADPKRPSVSVWKIALPHAGIPVSRLVLRSGTPLFSRQFRLSERRESPNGGTSPHLLATAAWSRRPEPGEPETCTLEIPERLTSDTLWLETDNGDNPAIALDAATATHPVARLVFKVTGPDGFELAYGRREAAAPQYDLRLVAARLLTVPRQVAQLAPAPAAPAKSPIDRLLRSANGGIVFWSALALVVVVLLGVVARLLPKSPGSP
ncbi:MAG: hypothetical protein C0502_00195 [Opitutus sp.]|nr:hypothetical protein [Opitutus sp.]